MSASFGASTLGVSAPQGYLQESSADRTLEVATIRSSEGKTVVAQPKPRSTETITVKTKGEVSFLSVPTANFSGATLTSAKVSETNDDFAISEATYTHFY